MVSKNLSVCLKNKKLGLNLEVGLYAGHLFWTCFSTKFGGVGLYAGRLICEYIRYPTQGNDTRHKHPGIKEVTLVYQIFKKVPWGTATDTCKCIGESGALLS